MPCVANVNSLRTEQYDVMNSEFEHYSSILTGSSGHMSCKRGAGKSTSSFRARQEREVLFLFDIIIISYISQLLAEKRDELNSPNI